MTDKRSALSAAIMAVGGCYAAAEAAGISPAWLYKCLNRGYLPAKAAYRLLRAADDAEPGAWPVSRLAELTVPREVRDV